MEPTGANSMTQSLVRGERVTLSRIDAFADGGRRDPPLPPCAYLDAGFSSHLNSLEYLLSISAVKVLVRDFLIVLQAHHHYYHGTNFVTTDDVRCT